MTPTFCNRCGDALEEGCDPRDELAELDALLERLRLKRYHLNKKINRFHSPILRQLPPDVMSCIFEFCLPEFTDRQLSLDYYSNINETDRRDLSIPLSLGAICSYWREIAWSTPSLWSSLVVRVTCKLDTNIATDIAQEWLTRSGQLPLSIHILSEGFYTKPVSALAHIINQYSSRWSDLDIPDQYYQYFHATDNLAPILKTIRLHRPLDAIGYPSYKFQLTCPRLERASFSCLPKDGPNIQWDNLTHLTVHNMSIIDSLLVLHKTPRLVFYKISDFRIHYGHHMTAPVPVLTPLRSLQLMMKASFIENFLNNIITPHLEELGLPYYYNPTIEVITSFLRRSACSLRSLSMNFSNIPPHYENFMRLLQSIPSLNTLSITSITTATRYTRVESSTPEYYDPRNILQLVAKVLSSQSTSHEQRFLPNLKILEYTGELYLRPGNYNDLYSLPPVDNVANGPLHLINFDLFQTSPIPKNMISYISSLEERGITVNVFCGPVDILQPSIDYYRDKEASLSRDWADNLDSSLF